MPLTKNTLNMKNRFYFMVMAVVGLMTACSSDEMETDRLVKDENLSSETTSYEMASTLLEAFKFSATRSPEDATNEYNYPNYYGGMHIDDTGKLNILIKGDLKKHKNTFIQIMGSDNAIFSSCENSYSELKDILQEIYNEIIKNPAIQNNFSYAKLNDANNNIVVGLEVCETNNINDFKNLIVNDSSIIFEWAQGEKEEESLKGGDLVYAYYDSNLLTPATMGYRAKLGTTVGWVTAAHAFTTGDYVYNLSGTKIGQCENSVYSWKIDAAFCTSTNSNYAPISSDPTTPGVIVSGMSVKLRGGKTQSTGKITNSSTVYKTTRDIVLNDVAFADYSSQGGDSGAAVISTSDGKIVGIHHGHDGNNNRVVIKEENIELLLGTYLY